MSFRIQLQDIDGNIESEKTISIGEGDLLLVQFPPEMTLEEAQQWFSLLTKGADEGGILGIRNTITFTLIKKEME